jgi:hypothetical protein
LVAEIADSGANKRHKPKELTMTDMTEKSDWRKAVRESNAIGWIAFLMLVFAIGVGTIMFGGEPISVKDQAAHADNSTGLKYLK